MNLLNKFSSKIKAAQVKVAVEYIAPHWVVLIQNPGHKSWIALRNPTKMIRVMNHFNDAVKQFPAIETFSSNERAGAWVKEHLPEAQVVQRSHGDVEKFLQKATAAIGSAQE